MASNAQRSPLKALIVDTNIADSVFLSIMLLIFQCEATMVKNVKEAVDLFLEGKKFDIVFCEKNIPIMNGPEAVEKIRAMGETDVKIVGLSVDSDAKEEFMSAGADAFVPKPIKLAVIDPILEEVINNKNAMV